MTAYIIRRVLQAAIVLVLVTMAIFLVMHLLPGDPVLLYVSQEELATAISEEELAHLYHKFGLDKPLTEQYVDWIWGVVHGDLGDSIFWGTTVRDEIGRALPISLYLGLMAFALGIIIGIPAGVVCAVRRGRWMDTVVTFFANIGICAPIFWVGILMIYLFGLYLGWLPIQGYTSPFDNFSLSIRQAVMPVICLAFMGLAGNTRQTRSSMLEVIQQDYIRTAWSKGLREHTIVMRHALKNGIIPVVTLAGMHIPRIFGGQVLVETIFSIPGMGRLAVDALFSYDYAVVQGTVLVIATIVVLCNLIVDISYGWLNPRVRFQ